MCVIYFGFGVGNYNIVAAANRDEYLDRPATRAHPWCEIGHPGILAGTDLGTVRVRDPLQPSRTAAQTATAGGDSTTPTPATATTEAESPLRIHGAGHGTWMGLNTATGTVAFLTNFREEPRLMDPRALSRGVLVRDALMLGGDTDADADAGGDGASPLERYVRRVHGEKHLYNGFNLVVGRIDSTSHLNDQQPLDAWYVGNRGPARPDPPRRLRRGVVYGLSNGVLVDGVSDWPKVEVGKGLVGDAIKESSTPNELISTLLTHLKNTTQYPPHTLPANMYNPALEHALSSICIPRDRSPGGNYGTRLHTVVVVRRDGRGVFVEEGGEGTGEGRVEVEVEVGGVTGEGLGTAGVE